jgi:nucleotide-binding universal stress UspA family protein
MKTVAHPKTRRISCGIARPKAVAASGDASKIRDVLIPIDFSPASFGAIEFALPLVRELGANLHLVHVSEPAPPLSSMVTLPLIVPDVQVGRRVRAHLKMVAKKFGVELRGENIHAAKGRPFEEICRLARQDHIDLIITSTHGHTGLKHLVLGSTAERLVRYSPCPVLVVRADDAKERRDAFARPNIQIRRILVPIDFSDCSLKGLAYAKAFARKFNAELVLINSVHVQYYLTSDEYARYDLPLLMQQAEEASREKMRELVHKTDWEGLKVQSLLQVGHPGDQICAQAHSQHADLIVTSTHGTTGFKHVLLGSTAEYVVRHADVPVLVVPSHERPVLVSTQ